MEQYLIRIQELIPALAERADLFLPKAEMGPGHEGYPDFVEIPYYRFAPWDGRTADLKRYRTTRIALKELLFPESETLYRYVSGEEVRIVPEPVATGEWVVLGARPCDCAALVRLDAVFEREPIDDSYDARRRRLTIIGLACAGPAGPACFCTSVGISPESTEGMDVRATALDGDDVLLEPVTAQGMAVIERLGKTRLRTATMEEKDQAMDARKRAAAVVPAYSLQPEALSFASPLWGREAATCVGCGTCAFLCPTCHCFTMEHHGNRQHGRVIRSWDTCQFPAYSLEASGFNPRPNKEDRMRQRILHKFRYYPESHGGTLMCVGCGRCVRLCPAGIDLRDILVAPADFRPEGKSNGNA